MSTEEKQLLRKILISGWSLLKSENLTEALEHIDEIVDAVSDLQKETDK